MKNLRLGTFIWLLSIITNLVPKECTDTWVWLSKLPWEDTEGGSK